MQKGFKLEFANGDTFVATSDIQIEHSWEPLFLLDGLRNFIAIYDQFMDQFGGKDGRADSRSSAVFAGFTGIHRVNITFFQFEDSTQEWGDSNDSDSAVSKLQTLNRTVTNVRTDSTSVATLQTGEYSSSGKHDPIDVVVGSSSLSFDAAEQSSEFTGSLELLDARDLTEAIDAQKRPDR